MEQRLRTWRRCGVLFKIVAAAKQQINKSHYEQSASLTELSLDKDMSHKRITQAPLRTTEP